MSNCQIVNQRESEMRHRPSLTWVAKEFPIHILIGAFPKLLRMCPGEGGGAIADAEWHYRHCPSSLVARVRHAAFQPAETVTATSISAASITAVVVAVATNADSPLPPAPPAEPPS